MRESKITYKGVGLTVKYDYITETKETWNNPYSPAEAKIHDIYIGGIDCTEIFTDEQFEEIETEILKEYEV